MGIDHLPGPAWSMILEREGEKAGWLRTCGFTCDAAAIAISMAICPLITGLTTPQCENHIFGSRRLN